MKSAAKLACIVLTLIGAGWADAASRSEQHFYDGAGRLVAVHYSDGSSVQFTYDGNGNMLSRTRSSTTPGPFPVQAGMMASESGADIRIVYPIAACNAPDHAVLFGAMTDASTVTAGVCSVGNDGEAVVTPPLGDSWFLVAGVDGTRYSSLGPASSGAERNPSGVASVCPGFVQDLSGACP